MNADTKITIGMDTKMNAFKRPRRGTTLLASAATLGLALSAAPAFAAQQGAAAAETHHLNGTHFLAGHAELIAVGGGQGAAAQGAGGGSGQGVLVAPAAPRGTTVFGGSFFGQDRDEVAYYKERIELLEKYVADARKKRDAAKDDAERRRLGEYIARSESDLERSKASLRTAEKRAPLFKLVDVKFTDATVKQAARALSDASGVAIAVEDSVPDTTRLTVEARRVRLVTVLESMAEQANVIIEPDERGGKLGIRLVSPPMLKVNEKETKFIRQNSPWSPLWGTPPTRRYYFADALSAVGGGGAYRAVIPPMPPMTINAADIDKTVREALAKAAQAQSLAPGTARSSTAVVRAGDGKSVTISVNNDTVIVTEPGKNDKGEAGVWMTVYKFDKDKKEMVKSSSMFHKTGDNKPGTQP
ncbi:MAG TPA: hypothetical protein VM490_22895 [Armatimonadaceae bacterium]|nr:hypothetical protein [Armatimonadaceae bacterium]